MTLELILNELDTPTLARGMPTVLIRRGERLLGYERSPN